MRPLYLVSEVAVLRVSLLPGAVRAPPGLQLTGFLRSLVSSVVSDHTYTHTKKESKCVEKLYILLQLGVLSELLQIPGESGDECLLTNVLLGVLNFFSFLYFYAQRRSGAAGCQRSTGESFFFPRMKVFKQKNKKNKHFPLQKKSQAKASLSKKKKKKKNPPRSRVLLCGLSYFF